MEFNSCDTQENKNALIDSLFLVARKAETNLDRLQKVQNLLELALEFASVPRIQSSLLLIFLLTDPVLRLTTFGWSELSELGEWLEFKIVPNFYYSKRVNHYSLSSLCTYYDFIQLTCPFNSFLIKPDVRSQIITKSKHSIL